MKSDSKSGSGDRRSDAVDYASKAARDNRADQLNPNNPKYYMARGLQDRPDPSPDGNPAKRKRRKR